MPNSGHTFQGEHLDLDFIKMNPKHEVPIFDHDGQIVTESRGIAKYFHENFNQDLEKNDHWYPKDPEERAKVRSISFLYYLQKL